MDWQYTTELEKSLSVRTGAVEVCRRVKYRRPGARRWERFLLFGDDIANVADDVVLAAIDQHAGVVPVPPR